MTAAKAAPTDSPLVDCHAHIYTLDMPLWEGAWHKPPADATRKMYLDTLDAHGVRYAVMAAASLYGDYNDYMIDAVKRHRDRLRTTVIVSPDIDQYTLKHMRDDGVVGVRFQWRSLKEQPDINSFPYQRLIRRIRDLDMHVHLNEIGTRLVKPVEALAKSGVKFVVDHFGRPDPAKGVACEGFQSVLHAAECGRMWVKISAAYRLPSKELGVQLAAELLKHVGPERLVWGSDWPFAGFEATQTYAETLEAFKRCVPDAAMRRRIGGETPLALYFA